MVSVTYGHGHLDDCNSTTGWTETESGMVGSLATDGDIFTITGTADGGAGDYVAYTKDVSNISSDIYTKYLFRYKTSVSSAGLAARAIIYFTSGNQIVIDNLYSALWKTKTGTITAGKTIDTIQIFAYNDTGATGTYYVYFDFILLYKNDFVFPHTVNLDFSPPPRYAQLMAPTRIGDITQNLGSESAFFHASCDLTIDNATNDWKRPQGSLSGKTDYINGEVFYDIAHNTNTEPWQWLDTGIHQFKATLETPVHRFEGQNRTIDLAFREYRLGSASGETYVERFGLNL